MAQNYLVRWEDFVAAVDLVVIWMKRAGWLLPDNQAITVDEADQQRISPLWEPARAAVILNYAIYFAAKAGDKEARASLLWANTLRASLREATALSGFGKLQSGQGAKPISATAIKNLLEYVQDEVNEGLADEFERTLMRSHKSMAEISDADPPEAFAARSRYEETGIDDNPVRPLQHAILGQRPAEPRIIPSPPPNASILQLQLNEFFRKNHEVVSNDLEMLVQLVRLPTDQYGAGNLVSRASTDQPRGFLQSLLRLSGAGGAERLASMPELRTSILLMSLVACERWLQELLPKMPSTQHGMPETWGETEVVAGLLATRLFRLGLHVDSANGQLKTAMRPERLARAEYRHLSGEEVVRIELAGYCEAANSDLDYPPDSAFDTHYGPPDSETLKVALELAQEKYGCAPAFLGKIEAGSPLFSEAARRSIAETYGVHAVHWIPKDKAPPEVAQAVANICLLLNPLLPKAAKKIGYT